ncbi:hypothetical protein [Aphanothece sacrum]|uniref:Exodeoxyribonuclease V subunit beta n=1 Tax=Aphanothece sacrum FPU1 TaxID=1920663 RepID=A0A401IER8_APHSA|nr:hypothetical protein [Aphanothece sacrum]GBF79699.1 exodeoxyribonuclease V subunit beta [Aphanothece sacrum FPU1]GBF79716.1 exodeoxyribonuclease V subunit beta [Aphanothece sacrum FPU1]GBF86303.1 exodeoxyribonuclease V subunit beta [Aphanothece sacrum FPU3]GBF87160.1 exodeoxyribonuclease V subunit beta [Aphanothece sacrum FPU3]
MTLTFRFDSGENWESLGSFSYSSRPIPGKEGQTDPIGFVTLPLTLQNHNIAVRCSGYPVYSFYRYWAMTYYLIEDLITLDGQGEYNRVEGKKSWIGETTIMTFPQMATNYKIGIEVPFWYDNFLIEVYEYTGPVSSSQDEKLDLLIRRLL